MTLVYYNQPNTITTYFPPKGMTQKGKINQTYNTLSKLKEQSPLKPHKQVKVLQRICLVNATIFSKNIFFHTMKFLCEQKYLVFTARKVILMKVLVKIIWDVCLQNCSHHLTFSKHIICVLVRCAVLRVCLYSNYFIERFKSTQ